MCGDDGDTSDVKPSRTVIELDVRDDSAVLLRFRVCRA